jgi:hypothetical protein
MSKATRTVLVKDLVVRMYFMQDESGEEVLDETRTFGEIRAEVTSRGDEILQDEDEIKAHVESYMLSCGKDGVAASVVPAPMLVTALHNALESGNDADRFRRNAKKIKAALDIIGFSAGRGGFKLAPPEVVAARRVARQLKRAENKAKKIADLVAAENAKSGK